MNTPTDTPPSFLLSSGDTVQSVSAWPDLGIQITRDGRQMHNLTSRLAKATAEFNKLSAFWSHAHINTGIKIKMYKAIFYPMVMYALHYSWMTKSMNSKLDSWQVLTLRRLLRIKASMISHVSNEEVLRRAKCTPLSVLVRQERKKYMGHVLRQDYNSTIHNICFDSSCKVRTPQVKRRRRRPLDNWTRKTIQEVLFSGQHVPLPSLRPNLAADPCTDGVLYARRIANNRTLWKGHIVRGAYAPARKPVGRRRAPVGAPADGRELTQGAR